MAQPANLLLDNDTSRNLRDKAEGARSVRQAINANDEPIVTLSALRACRSLMNSEVLNLREQDGTGFYFQLGDTMNELQNARTLRNVLMDARVASDTKVKLFAKGKAALLNWSNTLPPKIKHMEELIELFENS